MPSLPSRFSRLTVLALLLMSTALIAPPAQPALAAWTLDCDTAANIQVSAAQCKDLQSLYENLGGDGWTDNTNWGTDTDVGTWYGITRSGSNVILISQWSNNLSGDIDAWDPSALYYLQALYLDENQIGGSIDGWDVSALLNLFTLSLSGNAIGGDIDGWDISALTNLRELYMQGNQIEGNIDGFDVSASTWLREMYLNSNAIGGSIDGWDTSALTNLQYLYLNDNQIGGSIDGWDVSTLTRLHYLDLNTNVIGGNIDAWDVSALSTQEVMDLSDNAIGGSIDGWDVSGLSNLRGLQLDGNQIGGNLGGWDLSGLSMVTMLLLSGNALTGNPAALAYPASLEYLWLHENQLDGIVPDLTGTTITSGNLRLCPNTNVAPSGDAAVDTFAETNDSTGWSAVSGCGVLPDTGDDTGDGNDDGENNRVHPTEEEATPTSAPGPTVFGSPTVTVTVDPAGASPGGQVTWMVIVANESQHPTDNVLYMRSELPTTLALVTAESTRREVLVDGQRVETPIGVLDPGHAVTVTLVTAVGADAEPGEVCLTASADWNYLVSGTGCTQVLPDTLPATGGRPVAGTWWPWVAALGGVVMGIAALWLRRAFRL
jgi:hypothetical protein